MYALSHEKSWLIDDEMVIFGSMNATGNSMDRCDEMSGFFRAEHQVNLHAQRFIDTWEDEYTSPVLKLGDLKRAKQRKEESEAASERLGSSSTSLG